MTDTVQQLRNGLFVDILETGRQDSPRPRPGKSAPLPGKSAPLPGKSASPPGKSASPPGKSASPPGSSRPWSRYPPRTAETRTWRPPDDLLDQRGEKNAARRGAPSPVDNTPAPRAPKQVSFQDPPHSRKTESIYVASTGPARERRRRERLHPASGFWEGALRACMSATWGGSSASLEGAGGGGGAEARRGTMYMQPHAAASRARLGDGRVEQPAPRREETAPSRTSSNPGPTSPVKRRRRGGHDDVHPGPPIRIPSRRHTLLSTAAARLAQFRPRADASPPPDPPVPSSPPLARKLFLRQASTGTERETRRYWV